MASKPGRKRGLTPDVAAAAVADASVLGVKEAARKWDTTPRAIRYWRAKLTGQSEYERRIEAMAEFGVSRAVARGHARRGQGEVSLRQFRRLGQILRGPDIEARRRALDQVVSMNDASGAPVIATPEDLARALAVFGISRREAYSAWHGSPELIGTGT